jgi:hypothetical protein
MIETETSNKKALPVAWKAAWEDGFFRVQCALTFPLLLLVLFLLSNFLDTIENRPGVVLPDPILALFQAYDFTWLTFAIIYCTVLLGMITLSLHPRQLLLAIQAYIVLVIFRIGVMYVVPLDAPDGIIPLIDPFVQFFGSGGVLTKDLFFSGHTSILLLLFLTAKRRDLRVIFLVSAIIVGVCVIWQHVHYTIDVLVAPFFSYLSYRVVVLIHRRLRLQR